MVSDEEREENMWDSMRPALLKSQCSVESN